MKPLFHAYRVLATVVGCSIITLIVIGVPLEFAHEVFPNLWPSVLENGEPGFKIGHAIDLYLGTAHGFIYMGFVFIALILAMQARWSIGFTIVTLVCGTIPFVSFWAEARAIKRLRAEHPQLRPAAADATT